MPLAVALLLLPWTLTVPLRVGGRSPRRLALAPERRRQGSVTEPFVCPGFARYESHEGERPMAIRWRLEREIPAMWMPVMGLAV